MVVGFQESCHINKFSNALKFNKICFYFFFKNFMIVH